MTACARQTFTAAVFEKKEEGRGESEENTPVYRRRADLFQTLFSVQLLFHSSLVKITEADVFTVL